MADYVNIIDEYNSKLAAIQAANDAAIATSAKASALTSETNAAAYSAGIQEILQSDKTYTTAIAQTALLNATGYGIISGGEVTAQSTPDMTVAIAAFLAHMPITGKQFEGAAVSAQTITAADSTKPRIDLIYVNSSGVVTCLAGNLGTAAISGARTYTVTTNFVAAIAGSNTYTGSTNFVAGDTVAFGGITFTATAATQDTTDFVVGDTVADSMTNLATALNANSTVSATYTASAASGVITITENTAGGGNTPGSMTVTGTGVVAAGTATTSTAADTLTVGGVTLTATASTTSSTSFAVGATIADTVTNIKTALSANTTVTGTYTVTSSSATFTLTENTAGGGSTPAAATYTGTGVVSSGTATTSTAASATIPTLPSGGLSLASLYVGAGVTSIASSNITDLRCWKITRKNVRDFGIYPDGITDWRANGKLATALQWASKNKIPLYFPAGLYNSYFDNYWSDVTCIFEEGAEFAGTIHAAINDVAGTPTSNRPSNIKFIGTVTTYDRVGCYNCDDLYIQRIHIKSDATINPDARKSAGCHFYLDTKNLRIDEIVVDDVASDKIAAIAIDGNTTYRPDGVQTGRILVKDSEVNGVYLFCKNTQIGDVKVDGYGAGSQSPSSLVPNTTSDETVILHGFWANACTNVSVGKVNVNQVPGRTGNAGDAVFIDNTNIIINNIYAINASSHGLTLRGQVTSEYPVLFANSIEVKSSLSNGINLTHGAIKANSVRSLGNTLEGIYNGSGVSLVANNIQSSNNIKRQIALAGNSSINCISLEASGHTNTLYFAALLSGLVNSYIGNFTLSTTTKGLTGGLDMESCSNITIGRIRTLNCGISATFPAVMINSSSDITVNSGVIKDGLGQGLRMTTVTDCNFNGIAINGHDTNIVGATLTRVSFSNSRSINYTTAATNIASGGVATFNCTNITL